MNTHAHRHREKNVSIELKFHIVTAGSRMTFDSMTYGRSVFFFFFGVYILNLILVRFFSGFILNNNDNNDK